MQGRGLEGGRGEHQKELRVLASAIHVVSGSGLIETDRPRQRQRTVGTDRGDMILGVLFATVFVHFRGRVSSDQWWRRQIGSCVANGDADTVLGHTIMGHVLFPA